MKFCTFVLASLTVVDAQFGGVYRPVVDTTGFRPDQQQQFLPMVNPNNNNNNNNNNNHNNKLEEVSFGFRPQHVVDPNTSNNNLEEVSFHIYPGNSLVQPVHRCLSDVDCLQEHSRAGECPMFCIDGECRPHDKPYGPILRLPTGRQANFGRFTLREEEELERVFNRTDLPRFYDEEAVKGKFFELTDGSREILEVRYPLDFFSQARKHMESVEGHVDGTLDDAPKDDIEHRPSPLDEGIQGQGRDDPSGTFSPYAFFWDGAAGRRLLEEELGEGKETRRNLAIQGEDPDRWHVTNTASNPWRRNGRLSMGCTGAMIGNRVLVTAAHCVWDRETDSWADFPIYFAAGQDGDAYKPYGDARVWKMTIPAGYQTCRTNDQCRSHDWAVLVLYSWAELNVGYFGFSTSIGSSRLNLAGYPQSKNRELWYDHCSLKKDEGDYIKHLCDTEKGNSGSGIYKIVGGSRYVVAIHGGGYAYQWNRGADVDGDTSSAGRLYDRMLAYRVEYG